MNTLLFALTMCWSPSPDLNVTKYAIFVDKVFKDEIIAPAHQVTVAGLEAGRVYGFWVTARATAADGTLLESVPSNELRYVMPVMTVDGPGRIIHFQIPREANRANVEYFLESTTNLKNWANENYVLNDETGSAWFGPEPFKFYRVRLNTISQPCD